MRSINDQCPCGSGFKYKKCCKLFHEGKLPKNALELMKSRYSAYAYEQVGYIVKTTCKIEEDMQSFKAEIAQFAKYTNFEKLSIKEFIDGEDEAYVTFHAKLSADGKDISFSEKSRFVKKEGKWCYESGVIL